MTAAAITLGVFAGIVLSLTGWWWLAVTARIEARRMRRVRPRCQTGIKWGPDDAYRFWR